MNPGISYNPESSINTPRFLYFTCLKPAIAGAAGFIASCVHVDRRLRFRDGVRHYHSKSAVLFIRRELVACELRFGVLTKLIVPVMELHPMGHITVYAT
jgi:hypothetical protein